MKIEIKGNKYNVDVAYTEEEKEKGLQNITYLPDNEGMLFIYDEPEEISFWMKDTEIPLDIIFIGDDYEVLKVSKGEPNSEELHTCGNTKYVLELNINSGIEVGDELELPDDDSTNKNDKMFVLDENGNVQMTLDGGERIFSRKNTKTLLKMANRAYKSNKDADFKSLGKKVFEYLEIQDSKPEEYVD